MPLRSKTESHRRGSSGSTVRPGLGQEQDPATIPEAENATKTVQAILWVHDEPYSAEDILINDSILDGSGIQEGNLIEIIALKEASDVRDFQSPTGEIENIRLITDDEPKATPGLNEGSRYLCIAQFALTELKARQSNLQVSIKRNIAAAFGLRPRSQVLISRANFSESTASHVELGFRDAYLSRSDMWRLVGQELAGKTVYTGQKITFLGTIRVVVKAIHVKGHRVSTGFFSGTTVPVLRSEAARYVLFIQMSREMWDFDSEGNGEILFNRVVNGFLPDLFKKWTELEVRHLVSIVLFGRLEYNRYDFLDRKDQSFGIRKSVVDSEIHATQHQDFYRVVVTDMASAQWTTILDELKKDFRVFLRDISLYPPKEFEIQARSGQESKPQKVKITGRPSTAMKGNILEAINVASSQFANDYVDRDLIRTGISVMVITAGAGVFEVDRDLLNLTSENLTNNGIGIDIVCLSKMPLHSVPLFKYRPAAVTDMVSSENDPNISASPKMLTSDPRGLNPKQSQSVSPAVSSIASSSSRFFTSLSKSIQFGISKEWYYGIPHWIDLSYWSAESSVPKNQGRYGVLKSINGDIRSKKGPFIPRVRMYEVQMMGLMEMGLADISVPFLAQSRNWKQKFRKYPKTRAKGWVGSRSLSQSPKLLRKSATVKPNTSNHQGLLSTRTKALGDVFDRMDDFDEDLYHLPIRPKPEKSSRTEKPSSTVHQTQGQQSEKSIGNVAAHKNVRNSEQDLNDPAKQTDPKSIAPNVKKGSPPSKKNLETVRASRNISYALRGLAPPVRAVASIEVNIENAQAQPLRNVSTKSRPMLPSSSGSVRSLTMHGSVIENADSRTQNPGPSEPSWSKDLYEKDQKPSEPISIHMPNGSAHDNRPQAKLGKALSSNQVPKGFEGKDKQHENLEEAKGSSNESSDIEIDEKLFGNESFPNSVPPSTLPFILNVNASNPLKRPLSKTDYFGRWQHLYPRKPRAATVKWRSLCTPASVPLTTEAFPPKDEFESDYDSSTYDVALANVNDMQEVPETRDTLLREMLSLRFAHGYQLVVGQRLFKAVGPGSCDPSYFFLTDQIRPDGQFLFMSMGNTIQKLSLDETNRIRVTKLVRNPKRAGPPGPSHLSYKPHIRTILSDEYVVRSLELTGFSEQYPWEEADKYLADGRKELEDEVELLRFWRARFVLIPIEPPANARRNAPSDSEENEEEIHLRGIRILTQMWQKSRFIPPEERRPAQNRISAIKRKDRNPLRINMDTLNPSELVANALAATEPDNLLVNEEGSGDVQTTQLLPEAEQFERETATLTKLASAIQGEKGIEIRNRRWHLRLHYGCFEGEELTNWLVYNFRDIDTREEAVEFGNDLMNDGLFEHVNSRHNFKDGNFFYSIKSEWRLRPESKQSWFPGSRRSDRSVPPTPVTETVSKELPLTVRTRSGSSLANQLSSQGMTEATKTPGEKKRLVVSLSKTIRIDVDVRKRSNRPEIVNLHYDRLHNPENCYHLELSWLNVTSKLVDDAIVSWTSQAEKYGLKLVEVPIAEACEVSKNEPFRTPYRISLASEPPRRLANGNKFFTATSFEPQVPLKSDIHIYQKALLKKFNFVLDLEAVSEFPDNVEIQYSWGKLEYQYTQFVHRSGVVLAQITDEGDFLLLANRLYNSRLALTKDAISKFDSRKEPALHGLRPAIPPSLQASGVIGLNVQSPSPRPSPMMRASPDVPAAGRKPAYSTIAASTGPGATTYITPEQVKDDLEAFCKDKDKLEAFYREVTMAPPASAQSRKSGSTSSSMMRPIREPDPPIPEFRLPDALSTPKRKSTG